MSYIEFIDKNSANPPPESSANCSYPARYAETGTGN